MRRGLALQAQNTCQDLSNDILELGNEAPVVPAVADGEPPCAPKRAQPSSTWSGSYSVEADDGAAGLHSQSAGPSSLQQRILYDHGPIAQQLAGTAAAWCKLDVPWLAAMTSFPSVRQHMQAMLSKHSMSNSGTGALTAAAQNTNASIMSSQPSSQCVRRCSAALANKKQQQAADAAPGRRSLDRAILRTAPALHHESCSANTATVWHQPELPTVCQPIHSTADLLARLNSGHTSDTQSNFGSSSGKTASQDYEQQTDSFDVTSPEFVEACAKLDAIWPRVLADACVSYATPSQQQGVAGPAPASTNQTFASKTVCERTKSSTFNCQDLSAVADIIQHGSNNEHKGHGNGLHFPW